MEYSRRKVNKFKGKIDANDIPIAVIVAHYGGQVREGKSTSVKCVMHNDSRASASMNTYDNLYNCFTCGKGGNAVSIVCLLENLEFKDGLKRAIAIAAGSGAEIRSKDNANSSRRTRRTWDL